MKEVAPTENRDKAFHMLFLESGKYQASLQNRIKLIVKDGEVARELMQDVWVSALINSESLFDNTFTEKGRKAWLFKVASNKGFTYLRDHAKKSGLETMRLTSFLENIEDKGHSVSPETILANREVFNKKLEPLKNCSKVNQKIVFLRGQGYSYKEAGEALELSKQNVADRLCQLRKKLVLTTS